VARIHTANREMGLDERAVKVEIRDPNPDAATDPSIGGESSSLVVTLHLYGRLFCKGYFYGRPGDNELRFLWDRGRSSRPRIVRRQYQNGKRRCVLGMRQRSGPTASVIVSHEAEAEFFTHLDREIKMATNNAVPEDQSAELSA
jgi:hypothetical protein